MKSRSAIKIDLFADQCRRKKIESLGEPRAEIKLHIDFAAQAGEVDRIARRPVSRQGGRPPYPTKTMMGIPVFKRPYNPSDEQMEPTPLDCVNYKRFCGLESAPNIPDRTTVWTFESQIEKASAKALSDDASSQLLYKVVIARDGQIIDAPLAPPDWKLAKLPQKYLDLSWLQKQGKSHFGAKLSVNTNKKCKFIPKIQTDTVPTHDRQHFEKANMSRKVNADHGNPSAECKAWLEENSFRTSILQTAIEQLACRFAWHHRSGAGGLRDDDDAPLQPETARVFPDAAIEAFRHQIWAESLQSTAIGCKPETIFADDGRDLQRKRNQRRSAIMTARPRY